MISSYLVILSLLLIALWNNEASGSDFSSRVSTTSLLHPSDSSFSNAIDISDVTDSRKITLQSVTNKIRTQKLPIFEFARELDQLLTVEEDGEAVSEWSAGQLYQQYVDALRDFYYQDFINRCEQHGQRLAWCEQRDIVMREAEVAMKTAMPSRITATLSYQSQLEELRTDMESTITGAWDDNEDESDDAAVTAPKHHWLWNAKNKKRMKWILSQAVLLLLNFVQYEWHRRSARRAAQKRLAEVPEFPLL